MAVDHTKVSTKKHLESTSSRVEPLREKSGEASFSVSARVAMQLGRESISSSVTAILELVKNAYDADAEHVQVRFQDLNGPNASIVIEDDGIGMNKTDLLQSWMVIGSSHKSKTPTSSKKGRVMTGEKGLGRLGLDRLCRVTRIQTKTEDSTNALELEIDWSRYEGNEQRLESVKHQLYSLSTLDFDPLLRTPRAVPRGTRLILEGLRDKWTEDTLVALRKDLSLLLSPFAGPKDFAVSVDSGMGWSSVDGPVIVPKFVLNAATWKVVAKISEAGAVTLSMTSKLHDDAYHIAATPWKDFIKGADDFPACGPLRFEFYYFPRNPVTLDEQTLGLGDLNTFINSNQGIRIYRDRFRVKPYGDPDGRGDWLRLSYRKLQSPAAVSRIGDWRLAYNQVIGAVFIERDKNLNLSDQTNREGLVEGTGFRDLRSFAQRVVSYFELRHSEFFVKGRNNPTATEEAKKEAENLARASLEAMERLTKAIEHLPAPEPGSDTKPIAALRSAMTEARAALLSSQEAVRDSEKRAEAQLDQAKEEKNTMANLASLGILNVAFGHETLGLTDTAAKNAQWLQDTIVENAILLAPDYREDALRSLADLASCTLKIETFARFSLVTISPAKRRRRRFSLSALVTDVFETFKDSLAERNIKVQLKLPSADNIHIRAYPSDWDSVLVNLIINAVWAMSETHRDKRIIRVTVASKDKEAIITFEDSGRGLEAGTERQIFLPTFSTKRDEKGDTIGTGMGLTILRSCVEENSGGTVTARAKGTLGGAAFEIRVPRITTM